MGFWDKLLGKETDFDPAQTKVLSPAEGDAIPLADFPDEIFSQEVLGPGCGVKPTGDVVAAPFDGVVTQYIDTNHAIGVTSRSGVELLIHIGVDTVEMGGAGFRSFVSKGQKVKAGEKLICFDCAAIAAAGHPDAIAVVVTNADEFSSVEGLATGPVALGAPLLLVRK